MNAPRCARLTSRYSASARRRSWTRSLPSLGGAESEGLSTFFQSGKLSLGNPVLLHMLLFLSCSSPIRCARHERDSFLLGARSSVGDCRLIVDRRKMLAENVNRALAGLQGKAFGHQKMALESTLRLHNGGAARRVSAGRSRHIRFAACDSRRSDQCERCRDLPTRRLPQAVSWGPSCYA